MKINKEAEKCLKWFKGHPYYGDNKSYLKAIIRLTQEWFIREGKDYKTNIFSKWNN